VTNLSRTSEDSLGHSPEHPPIMQGSVGTQSPSSVGFSVGFGELWRCRSDGGIENDAVYITLLFVHCKAFSWRPRLFDEWYSVLYRRVRLFRMKIYCT